MSLSADIRIRRPQRHEVLVKQLVDERVFDKIRDVLLFAASIGFANQRRTAFDKSGEQIRYETVTEPAYADALINMVAVLENETDPEVLGPDRLADRIRVFEEFANGGLDLIQEKMNMKSGSAESIVESFVRGALDRPTSEEPVSVEDLLSATTWRE